jgi:putative exporter of polyketide antibiotics
MISKIKGKLREWSNSLIQKESKYWAINKLRRFLATLLVNTFTTINTAAVSSFILFAIAFSIDDDKIIGDYIFLVALIIFLVVIGIYFLVGMFYAFKWLFKTLSGKGE